MSHIGKRTRRRRLSWPGPRSNGRRALPESRQTLVGSGRIQCRHRLSPWPCDSWVYRSRTLLRRIADGSPRAWRDQRETLGHDVNGSLTLSPPRPTASRGVVAARVPRSLDHLIQGIGEERDSGNECANADQGRCGRPGHRNKPSIRSPDPPLQERGRDRQAEGLRGFKVDDQFELCGLLDGQVTGLGILTDAIDVARRSADNHAERHRSWGNQG